MPELFDVTQNRGIPVVAAEDTVLGGYRRRLVDVLDELDLAAVSRVVDCLFEAWQRRALVAIAGNGGSASTTSHMVNDLVKATRVGGRPAFRAVSLVDNGALMTALANDLHYDAVFAHQLEGLFDEGDVLILLSASGESPNVVAAAQRARELGGTSIALLGFSGGALGEIADLTVHVDTRPGEYGPVEDIHLIVNHMVTDALRARIATATL